jgi:hypothetical protein
MLIADFPVRTQKTSKLWCDQRMVVLIQRNPSHTTYMFPYIVQSLFWLYTKHELYSLPSSSYLLYSCASKKGNLPDYKQIPSEHVPSCHRPTLHSISTH